jgi:anti-anti-sigma factor
VAELRAAVIGAAGDADLVRLDLSGVVFIDTTGLGALLELHSTLERRGVALEVVAAEGPVRHAVEITGLAHLLI